MLSPRSRGALLGALVLALALAGCGGVRTIVRTTTVAHTVTHMRTVTKLGCGRSPSVWSSQLPPLHPRRLSSRQARRRRLVALREWVVQSRLTVLRGTTPTAMRQLPRLRSFARQAANTVVGDETPNCRRIRVGARCCVRGLRGSADDHPHDHGGSHGDSQADDHEAPDADGDQADRRHAPAPAPTPTTTPSAPSTQPCGIQSSSTCPNGQQPLGCTIITPATYTPPGTPGKCSGIPVGKECC